MKSLRAVFAFLILLEVGSSALQAQETVSATVRPAWIPLIEKAKQLETQGSYLEAKEIYESLLKRTLPRKRKLAVRKTYEDLQVKILFSPLETPDSFLYTVASGDTLSGLAEKFGTTIELLQKSNRISGETIYYGKKLKITKNKFSILVEKGGNRLHLLADDKLLKTYRVATGDHDATPEGVFKIVSKLKNPTWFHAGLVLPPDSPKNILGTRWLGFDRSSYGIHGTTLPETIGTHASKGCVRMLNQDVEEIYALIPIGTRVVIKK